MCAVVGGIARDDTRHRTGEATRASYILIVTEEISATIEVVDVEVRHGILGLDIVACPSSPGIVWLLLDRLSEAGSRVGDLDKVHRLLKTDREACTQSVADT